MAETPEHVEKMASGGLVCRHCGGMVDAEGYAEGGEDSDIEQGEASLSADDDGETSPQYEAIGRMRRASFADAVSKRGR